MTDTSASEALEAVKKNLSELAEYGCKCDPDTLTAATKCPACEASDEALNRLPAIEEALGRADKDLHELADYHDRLAEVTAERDYAISGAKRQEEHLKEDLEENVRVLGSMMRARDEARSRAEAAERAVQIKGDSLAELQRHYAALRSDVERLRGALEGVMPDATETLVDGGVSYVSHYALSAARAALSGESTEPGEREAPNHQAYMERCRGDLWKDEHTALSSRVRALETGLAALGCAEEHYRTMHDLYGDGAPKSGRAWDLMRRSGDAARALLSAPNAGAPRPGPERDDEDRGGTAGFLACLDLGSASPAGLRAVQDFMEKRSGQSPKGEGGV